MPKKGGSGGGNKPTAKTGKPVLSKQGKATVSELKELGVEDPRKFFLAGKSEGIKNQAIIKAATNEGARYQRIISNPIFTRDQDFGTVPTVKPGGRVGDAQVYNNDDRGVGFSGSGGGGGGANTTAAAATAAAANLGIRSTDFSGRSVEDIVAYGAKRTKKTRGKKTV